MLVNSGRIAREEVCPVDTQDSYASLAGKNIRILYIEDDAGLARLLQKKIERQCEIQVETAADGEMGVSLSQEQAFDAAIIDYNLPGISGLDVLKQLKGNDPDLPVIILTGAGNEEVAASVMKAGALDYLVKGVGEDFIAEICSSIRHALSEKQKRLDQKKVFARWQLAKIVFDITKEGIVVTDANNTIETVNPAFKAITGYSYTEVVGQNPSILQSGRHDEPFYQQMWQSVHKQGFWEGEIWNKKKSGLIYPEWLAIHAILDEAGEIIQYVAVFSDITQRKANEEKIWHQANHDALTDLPNRTLLVDRAESALQRAKREHTNMAVMFMDLDHFKHINDHYGHAAGDELLITVAERISSTLRKSDMVVRISGDEFVVLMPLLEHSMDAGRVAEKIISTLSQPYLLCDNNVHISASAGIAVFPGDGDHVEALMKHADLAMYKAKESGRNQHVFYDQKMNEVSENRTEVEHDLIQALQDNQLVMYYQPVTDIRSNKITHAEALIRWQHPVKGLVPPDDFIPIAEQCGLIISLGEWVVSEVSRQVSQWQSEGKSDLHVFLNVSPIQLMHSNLPAYLAKAAKQFPLSRGNIGIEITENVLIDGPDKIKQVLDVLKDEGINFLIDDFGTGFSSMRYLQKLPFDGLKIDRSFVSMVDEDHEKAVLVKAMIHMAHSLNLTVVAEGIEREQELAFLRAHDCDFAQGYLLGRPEPAEKFIRLL